MARKKNWWEDPGPAKRGSTAKFTSTGTQFPRFVQATRTSSRVPGAGRTPGRGGRPVPTFPKAEPRRGGRPRPSETFTRAEPRRGGRPRGGVNSTLPPVQVSAPPKPPGPPKQPPKHVGEPYISKPPTEQKKPPPTLPKTY